MAGGLSKFTALQVPTADQLNSVVQSVAYKASNETYASSTAMHTDAELFVSVAASSAYRVQLIGGFGAIAAAAFKFQFSVPSGASFLQSYLLWTYSGGGLGQMYFSAVATPTSSTTLANFDGSAVESFLFNGVLTTGANSGTLAFQWAQNASNASGTSVFAGTTLVAQKIG